MAEAQPSNPPGDIELDHGQSSGHMIAEPQTDTNIGLTKPIQTSPDTIMHDPKVSLDLDSVDVVPTSSENTTHNPQATTDDGSAAIAPDAHVAGSGSASPITSPDVDTSKPRPNTLNPKSKKRLLAMQQKVAKESKQLSSRLRNRDDESEPVIATEEQNEHAWMTERPQEDDIGEEHAAFMKAEKALKRKASAGTLSLEEEIEFKRYEKKFLARMAKERDDVQHEMEDEMGDDVDDTLFIGDSAFAGEGSLPMDNDEDEHEIEVSRQVKRRRPNTSQNAPDRQLSDVEIQFAHAMGVGIQAAEGRKNAAGSKKAKNKATPKKPSKVKGKGIGKGKGKGNAKPKPLGKRAAAKAQSARNLLNLNSVMHNDVFRDAETNRGRTDLPSFTSKEKREAMNQLVASLPSDARPLAETDKAQILRAAAKFTGKDACTPDGAGQWQVKGMKSVLSHYQMLGVSSMRERECQTDEPRGGLLADAMGLGKTIMMIANIVNGRRRREAHGPTLIVAPGTIITQWMEEISKHAESKAVGDVVRHHSGARVVSNHVEQLLSKYGIILTTYSEIAKSYPKWDPPLDVTTAEDKAAWWQKEWEEKRGPLHRINFQRVILDEAQAIKNHQSQASIGCRGLIAVHRWAISGTPVQNSVAEFYPYFRFLKVPFIGNYKLFKKNFCALHDPSSLERLGLFLSPLMIRRSHNDTLLGQKLLDLPPPMKKDMPVIFSPIEREIYMVVRQRFVVRINGFSRNGELQKKYNHILTMLLRLRQIVAHPLLIQDTLRELLEPIDIALLRSIANREIEPHEKPAAVIYHLREMLRSPSELVTLEAVSSPRPSEVDLAGDETGATLVEVVTPPNNTTERTEQVPATTDQTTVGSSSFAQEQVTTPTSITKLPQVRDVGGAFGAKNSWGEYVDDLKENSGFVDEEDPAKCCSCGEPPSEKIITSCGHTYCYGCLLRISAKEKGDHAKCISCGAEYTAIQPYNRNTSAETNAADSESPSASQLDGEKKKRANKLTPAQVIDTWVDAKGHMLPSAKTYAIKCQILEWFKEDPNVKILIYSQFLTMIRIISKMCSIEGWGYAQFTGVMDMQKRDKMIKTFNSDPSVNIMICSLKTGGTGLNLTVASRVLMVDLWWNSSVEMQAFCRTYRRGQTKKTVMTRLVVQDTVDTDIIKMQLRKDTEIGQIMPDGERQGKKLSTKELLSLFGETEEEEDVNGNRFTLICDSKKQRAIGYDALDDDDSMMTDAQ